MPRTAEIDTPEKKPATKRKAPKGRSTPIKKKRPVPRTPPQHSTTGPQKRHPEAPSRTPPRPRPKASAFLPTTPTAAPSPAQTPPVKEAPPPIPTPKRPRGTPETNPEAFGSYWRDLCACVKRGDRASRDQLRELLADFADLRELIGNVAHKAQQDWIKVIAGGDVVTEEAVGSRLVEMRRDLLGKDPTPLEEMAVENVLGTWLAVHESERAVSGAVVGGNGRDMLTITRVAEAAQRRHESAVKMLTQVRRKLK